MVPYLAKRQVARLVTPHHRVAFGLVIVSNLALRLGGGKWQFGLQLWMMGQSRVVEGRQGQLKQRKVRKVMEGGRGPLKVGECNWGDRGSQRAAKGNRRG